MKKCIAISMLSIIIILGGCSNKVPGVKQSDDIKKIKISNSKSLDSINENYDKSFSDKEEVKVFKNAFKNAKKQKRNIENFDFDMVVTFEENPEDPYEKLLHITKNQDKEIVLNYLGDSDTYVLDENNSDKLIKILY